jgi:hypothetical protein
MEKLSPCSPMDDDPSPPMMMSIHRPSVFISLAAGTYQTTYFGGYVPYRRLPVLAYRQDGGILVLVGKIRSQRERDVERGVRLRSELPPKGYDIIAT